MTHRSGPSITICSGRIATGELHDPSPRAFAPLSCY